MELERRSKILLVDDDKAALEALAALFEEEYNVILASSGEESLEKVETVSDIAAVVMDIKMPGMDGITAAREIRRRAAEIPVIFHTGYPGDYNEDEIDAQERPFDYVKKADPVSKLTRSVRNAVEAYQSRRDIEILSEQAEATWGLIGKSNTMHEVFGLIRKTARVDTKVMIWGETGTGKELVARAIHDSSKRRAEKFGIVNCNHKTTELVEAELFGYKRGAFTGAHIDRKGLFEIADKGTVFLDEIGDLSSTTQIALLRVLETGEYQQIGPEAEEKKTDVRILCATHRNLDDLVKRGRFREDLHYRLKGITINLPPLRDHREDIPLLVERFVDRFTIEQGLPLKLFDRSAMSVLLKFGWPGNVRQLLDTVESLIVLTDSDLILAEDVERYLGLTTSEHGPSDGNIRLPDRVRDFRRTLIIEALHETDNNISAAARILGIDRNNLRKMIIDHEINLQ